MYVYGKSFVLESDHKPLEMINLKNLAAAPQRLQRMFLRVQPFVYNLCVTLQARKANDAGRRHVKTTE